MREVVPAAVEQMWALEPDPARLIAGIRPAIRDDRNQVGADVVAATETAFGDQTREAVRHDEHGKWTFDLAKTNGLQLLRAGIPGDQFHQSGRDTGPATPFFSHRAAPCGRSLAAALIRATPR